MLPATSRAQNDDAFLFSVKQNLMGVSARIENPFTRLAMVDTRYANAQIRDIQLGTLLPEVNYGNIYEDPGVPVTANKYNYFTDTTNVDVLMETEVIFSYKELDQNTHFGGQPLGTASFPVSDFVGHRISATIARFAELMDKIHYRLLSHKVSQSFVINADAVDPQTIEQLAYDISGAIGTSVMNANIPACIMHPAPLLRLERVRTPSYQGAPGAVPDLQRRTPLFQYEEGRYINGVNFIPDSTIPVRTYTTKANCYVTRSATNPNNTIVIHNRTGEDYVPADPAIANPVRTTAAIRRFRPGEIISFLSETGKTVTVSLVRPTGNVGGTTTRTTNALRSFYDINRNDVDYDIDGDDGTSGPGTAEFEVSPVLAAEDLPYTSISTGGADFDSDGGDIAQNPLARHAVISPYNFGTRYYQCLALVPNSYTIFMRRPAGVRGGAARASMAAAAMGQTISPQRQAELFTGNATLPGLVYPFGFQSYQGLSTPLNAASTLDPLLNFGGTIYNGLLKEGAQSNTAHWHIAAVPLGRPNYIGAFVRVEVEETAADARFSVLPKIF